VRKVYPAIAEMLGRHNAVVLVDYQGPKAVGSGIFVYISGIPGVFTAKHVWEKACKFGKVYAGSFILCDKAGGVMRDVWMDADEIIKVGNPPGFDLDLVFIKLKKADYDKAPELFVIEDQIDMGPVVVNHEYLLSGFPDALTRDNTNTFDPHVKMTLYILSTNVPPIVQWSNCYSPEYNYVLEYPRDIDSLQHGVMVSPFPNGMSGGGIWRAKPSEKKIFVARDRISLVGIEHEWDKTKGIVAGSQIKFLEPISKIISGQNHDCSQFNEPKKVGGLVFPSAANPSEVLHPGEDPLNLPSPPISSKLSSILCFSLHPAHAMR
jgi:hypothetical protein